MPLTGNFSLRDVSNEFGSNTRPATLSLRNFYTAIFGSAPAGSRLSDFSGYGQPNITGFSASQSATLGGYVELDFTTDWNNSTMTVIAQYNTDGGSSWTTHTTQDFSSDGAKSFTLLMPDESTTYYFRLVYYNDFNSASGDRKTTATDSAVSSNPNKWATPSPNCLDTFRTGAGHAHIEWSYGDEPSSFSCQESTNNGSTWINKTLVVGSDVNWGTLSNPKEGEWQNVASGSWVRIRADAEGGVAASDWSSHCVV